MGDAAYGAGKVPGRPDRKHFPTFTLTWQVAPVRRGRLPAVPAGKRTDGASRVYRRKAFGSRYVGYVRSASGQRQEGTRSAMSIPRKPCTSVAAPTTTSERDGNWRWSSWACQSRYFGRRNSSGGKIGLSGSTRMSSAMMSRCTEFQRYPARTTMVCDFAHVGFTAATAFRPGF